MAEEVLYRAPESMPEPFAKGTEIPFAYQHPCHARFENLCPELEAIVSAEELAQWRKSRRLTMDTHSLHDYCNLLYSFICDFEQSREQVQTAMKDYIAAWDYDVSLRQDELDAILSGNMSAMLTDFNEPYSGTLVVGDQIYTREWCYYHTIDDYADAGISPQQLYDNWQQITEEMTQEAKDQFYMKVMAYMQQYTYNYCSKRLSLNREPLCILSNFIYVFVCFLWQLEYRIKMHGGVVTPMHFPHLGQSTNDFSINFWFPVLSLTALTLGVANFQQ